MSHFHFVASDEYRHRVIQLGEDPARVFIVGGLGLDSLARLSLMKKEMLEAALEYRFQRRDLLVTFHPVTLEVDKAAVEFGELLEALDGLDDTGIFFTLTNSDTESRGLLSMRADAHTS